MLEEYPNRLLVRPVNQDSTPFEMLRSVKFLILNGFEMLTDRDSVTCHEKKILCALIRIGETNYAP